jgi:hypothetical protein
MQRLHRKATHEKEIWLRKEQSRNNERKTESNKTIVPARAWFLNLN